MHSRLPGAIQTRLKINQPTDEYEQEPEKVSERVVQMLRLTRRICEGARILQIQLLDHVIIGQPMNDRSGYFSFREAGTIG
jgi:DNA repair protein RadC